MVVIRGSKLKLGSDSIATTLRSGYCCRSKRIAS